MVVTLCVVYGSAYLYAKVTGTSLQSNKYAFVALILVISVVLVLFGLYFSKKFGIEYEFKTVAKIAGIVVWVVFVAGYLYEEL